MITAREALELYSASNSLVENYLEQIAPQIKHSAENGLRNLWVTLDGMWQSYETPVWPHPKMTPIQSRVQFALEKYGYTVQFGAFGPTYVPVGLRDLDGSGPVHQNYGLVISW